MLVHTRGIVLKTIRYGETSLIVTAFTEELGMRSYMINGVRTARAKISASLLQVMSLTDMVVYHRDNKDLNRVTELRPAYIYNKMPYDVVRSSVGLFIAEVTMKSIRETEPNPALFEFLFETFVKLDDPTIPVTHFHLFFLLRFSGYLGFMPGGDEFEEMEFFDLKEGVFMVQEPVHRLYAQGTEVSLMQTLMQAEWFDLTEIKSHSSERKKLLEHLINYYKYHIDGMGDIHAHHILAEVL